MRVSPGTRGTAALVAVLLATGCGLLDRSPKKDAPGADPRPYLAGAKA
ncbi:hypothetical protein [Actinomadura kijaniata]|nr:hypothetical protein [Actinomadura kijaniata]